MLETPLTHKTDGVTRLAIVPALVLVGATAWYFVSPDKGAPHRGVPLFSSPPGFRNIPPQADAVQGYSNEYGTSQQQMLVKKARQRVPECKALGDIPITRRGKVIVCNLGGIPLVGVPFGAHEPMLYSKGNGPVTVFLVTTKKSKQVGTYSISGQPGYQKSFEVYVIQFRNLTDSGTAVAAHEGMSLDPLERRPVEGNPEFGDIGPALSGWISSLPVYGSRELVLAAKEGKVDTLKALIAAGADGDAALMSAAEKGNTRCLRALIAAGEDAKTSGAEGETVLIKAAKAGHADCVQALIFSGASVNAKANGGRTALREAACGGHTDCVQALISAGADVNAKDDSGNTALTLAKAHPDIVAALTAAGATE